MAALRGAVLRKRRFREGLTAAEGCAFDTHLVFVAVAPAISCDKYYGRAVTLDAAGAVVADRAAGVGTIVRCDEPSHAAFAWEYTSQVTYATDEAACAATSFYGCLNMHECCGALDRAFRRYAELLGVLALIWSVLVVRKSGDSSPRPSD